MTASELVACLDFGIGPMGQTKPVLAVINGLGRMRATRIGIQPASQNNG